MAIATYLAARPRVWALCMIVAGAIAALWVGSVTFLGPDEALHAVSGRAPLLEAWRGSRFSAHPPLYFLFLHVWQKLAGSEWTLRSSSTLAMAAALFLHFSWLRKVTDDATARFALVLMVFSPATLELASEVRHYALLLFFGMLAVWALEREARALGSLACCAASLTHYSALWLVLPLALRDVSAALRARRGMVACALTHFPVAAVWLYSWKTHLHLLRGSAMERGAANGWLSSGYLHQQPIWRFVISSLNSWSTYLFADRTVGMIATAVALCGLVLLWRSRRGLALFVVSPLLLLAIAGVAGVYPFEGGRHDAVLLPFWMTLIAVALARLSRAPLAPLVLAPLAAAWLVFAGLPRLENSLFLRPRSAMQAALADVRQRVPREPLFTSMSTAWQLFYYLQAGGPPEMQRVARLQLGGALVVVTRGWDINEGFPQQLATTAASLGMQAGSPVWVMDAGGPSKPSALPDLGLPLDQVHRFGGIVVARTVVPDLGMPPHPR